MENHASSTGTFYEDPSHKNYYQVDIETHPWQEGFVTDVYVKQFANDKEILTSRKSEEFLTDNPIDAYNLHAKAESQARGLGEGYFSGFNHFDLELHFEPFETTVDPLVPQQDVRAHTKDSNNNRPENVEDNLTDDLPSQSNEVRGDRDAPETTKDSDAPESFGDQTEREVTEFFGEGQKGASILKEQLGDYVSEGGSPILGALGATGLDALNLAMGFGEGTITGILDTRNLGEGIKKGTAEGAKEDAARLLNILPQGRVARVLNTALTVSDLVDEAAEDDIQGFGAAAAIGAVSVVGGRKRKGNKRSKKNNRGKGNGRSTFESYESMPKRKGLHRHHIALAAIFRRANSPRLRALENEIGSEYVSELTHQVLHKIVNDRLRMKSLFPGSGRNDKRVFTKKEVSAAINELIKAYERENVPDFANYLRELLKDLRRQRLVG